MSADAKLTRGGIRGHLITQTAPMIIGVAALMSIGLVDSYFIGQLGSAPLTAVAFIFPISVALSSLGVGMMVGINSVVARALGENARENAVQKGSFGIILAVGVGVCIAASLYLLLDPLFTLMQADTGQLALIRAYMAPYALGFPLLMLIMGVNGVMRGQGEAKKTSYISITYAAANWVLDPFFITGAFGFEGYGIAGAAYATITGWLMATIFGFWLLSRTALPFDFSKIRECKIGPSFTAVASVAGPAAFSNAINPIGLSVLTALAASHSHAAAAGMGAAGRLQSFTVVPLLALSGAIGAIVGQNWGANKPDRSRNAVAWASGFTVIYGLTLALILFAACNWFAQFFTQDPAILREFSAYLSLTAWGYAGYGLLIVSNGALNAVGKAKWALLQSFARVFLIMLPVAWLCMPAWGTKAIYAAELAANVIGGSAALLIVWCALARKQ